MTNTKPLPTLVELGIPVVPPITGPQALPTYKELEFRRKYPEAGYKSITALGPEIETAKRIGRLPLKVVAKALQWANVPITRLNKSITQATFMPVAAKALDTYKRTGKLPSPGEVAGQMVISYLNRIKALAPLPHVAEDLPTFGQLMAEKYYPTVTDQPAPDWYAPSMDMALDTLILAGLGKLPSAIKTLRGTPSRHQVKQFVREVEEAVAAMEKSAKPRIRIMGQLGPTPTKPRIKVMAELGETYQPPEKKLTSILRGFRRRAKISREQAQKVLHEQMRQAAIALQKGPKGKRGMMYVKSKFKGARKPEFPDLAGRMTQSEWDALHEKIRTHPKLLLAQKVRAHEGLREIEELHRVPAPSKRKLLGIVLGKDFQRALDRLATMPDKVQNAVFEGLGLWRNFITAYDLSHSLRQSAMFATRHPVLWTKAVGRSIRSAYDPQYFKLMEETIAKTRYYDEGILYGVRHAYKEMQEGLAYMPEEMMTTWANKIRGLAATNRAFIAMGDNVRWMQWNKILFEWGGKATSAEKALLANWINAATGWGKLPAKLAFLNPLANQIIFSPRFTLSWPQRVYYLAKAPFVGPRVTKVIAGDFSSFILSRLALLATLDASSDNITVEWNPTSTDFALIRIGNTRIDPWAGLRPWVTRFAQVVTQQRKQAYTGKPIVIKWTWPIKRLVRGKLAPGPALAVDIWTGKTYSGDEVTLRSLPIQIGERLIPLALKDVLETAFYQGVDTAIKVAPLVIMGTDVQTWQPTEFQKARLIKDEAAHHYSAKNWDDLDIITQLLILCRPYGQEIIRLEREGRTKKQEYPFLEEQQRMAVKVANKMFERFPQSLQDKLTDLLIKPPQLSRLIGIDSDLKNAIASLANIKPDTPEMAALTELLVVYPEYKHYLNDNRYKQYQDYFVDSFVQLYSKNKKMWDALPDALARQEINKAVNMARKVARNFVIINELKAKSE